MGVGARLCGVKYLCKFVFTRAQSNVCLVLGYNTAMLFIIGFFHILIYCDFYLIDECVNDILIYVFFYCISLLSP